MKIIFATIEDHLTLIVMMDVAQVPTLLHPMILT